MAPNAGAIRVETTNNGANAASYRGFKQPLMAPIAASYRGLKQLLMAPMNN